MHILCRSESRSRSELLREAARLYIECGKRLKSIIGSMRTIAAERGIAEEDVTAGLRRIGRTQIEGNPFITPVSFIETIG